MEKIFVVFCTIFLLGGCVTQDLSIENRHKITTVTILPASFSEQQFKYTSMDQAWGAGLGAGAGAAVGMASDSSKVATSAMAGVGVVAGAKVADGGVLSPRQAILLNLQRNKIDPGKLFKQQMEARISAEHLFKVVSEDSRADAHIEFVVSEWGFALKNYSAELYPTVGIVATMKLGDAVVWRNFETVTAFSEGNVQAYTPQEYSINPEALRSTLQNAFELVIAKLIADLKQ
ncbi:hypothetical protein MRY17_00795 [Pseudomonas orientalis]|uniref:hypothetical protein n=1 Tax=Pseudomonas orientalis TaxID=76758 RepID=UPI001FAF5533|nr:hypothetical protein [Pseudomonas orientalis]UOB24272.1 hypothetical protein MRY17_00795 [Pseudomonas orientalis]